MGLRLRVLQIATACLYLGPLLAGLSDYGWSVVPVFVLIFLLWLIVLRPQEWPQSRADWMQPDHWLAVAARTVVQVLLVVLCFGVGRGLAGVAGVNPVLPFMGPVFLSLIAVPMARLTWPSKHVAASDGLVMAMPVSAERAAMLPDQAERQAEMRLFAARLTEPLTDLRPDTAPSVIEAHLAALQEHLPHDALLEALHVRLASPVVGPAIRRAFILLATDPLTAEACRGRAAPVKALQVAGGDADLVELFARRCTALLEADADAWGDCPNATALAGVEAGLPAGAETARAALAGLAARNRALAPLG